jgi:riboflavin transporter FmnP
MVIEIAIGIVIGAISLAVLPILLVGAYWAAAVGIVLVLIVSFAWLLWEGAQSTHGLAVEFILGGFFLIWLAFEIKARREAHAEISSATSGVERDPRFLGRIEQARSSLQKGRGIRLEDLDEE